jgi:hypothetical protein
MDLINTQRQENAGDDVNDPRELHTLPHRHEYKHL